MNSSLDAPSFNDSLIEKYRANRETVLSRIDKGLARSLQAGNSSYNSRNPLSHTLESTVPRPIVPLENAALRAFFVKQALAMSCTVQTVERFSQVADGVEHYLHERSIIVKEAHHTLFCADDLFRTLTWSPAYQPAFRAANAEDRVGLTTCFCAIADTGTLMLTSSQQLKSSAQERDAPLPLSEPLSLPLHSSISLLPETHIAVVPANRIVPYMEEAWALFLTEHSMLPRAVNFVSGPSRTGDIEQTIVLGAHGPCRVHVIVVEEMTR